MKKDTIQKWVNNPISSGDIFYSTNSKYKDQQFYCLGLSGKFIIACTTQDNEKRVRLDTTTGELYKLAKDFKGVNPIQYSPIQYNEFNLYSILWQIGFDMRALKYRKDIYKDIELQLVNWNPYFIIDGKKECYQRGYVWTLEQKQALIDTVYRGLDIGRVILHEHSIEEQEMMYNKGFTDFAHFDIVDGKQRLSTLIEFMLDKFEDADGNYYSELTSEAKRIIGNYKGLKSGTLDEHSTPQQVAQAFLNNAVSGTPISKEHIDYMLYIKSKL